MKLDLKDKKALYEIDFDARKTYSKISKSIKMSKKGTIYKIKSLEKRKIILGYSPVINISRLGYIYCRVFIKFQNLTKEIENEIENYIISNKNIGWSIKYYGLYDQGFTIWAKNITEFKTIINEFYYKFSKYIKNRVESIVTNLEFLKNRYLLEKKDYSSLNFNELEPIQKIDKTDIIILNELIKNPIATLIEIYKNTKINPKTISYRIKKLKDKKILLGIRPIINHELLGYSYYKIFFNFSNFNKKLISEFEEYIKKDNKTIYIIKSLGSCDLDIEIIVKSNSELIEFIENINNKFPGLIKDYETMLLTKTIKIQYLPKEYLI